MVVELVVDYSDYNYAGHEQILKFLLGAGKDPLLEQLNIYEYFESNSRDPQDAKFIVENVLGNIKIGDIEEAKVLLDEFNAIYTNQKVSEIHDDLISLISTNPAQFPKDALQTKITNALSYGNATTISFSEIINTYQEVWSNVRSINSSEIEVFRTKLLQSLDDVPNATVEFTTEGLRQALSKISNSQFKRLYRSKFPDVTDAEIHNIMNYRKAGAYDYDNLANIMRTSDKATVVNSLDDLTLSSMCKPSNFNVIKKIDFPKAVSMSGNAISFIQLIHTLKNDIEVSPLDVLSVVPHPISIFSVLGELIVQDAMKQQGEFTWEYFDYSRLLVWNEKYMGEPGLPDEYLYMCYTDQSKKCNPSVLPTSIVFKDKIDAFAVFGFSPTVVDFDVKSSVYKEGVVNFRPTQQAIIP